MMLGSKNRDYKTGNRAVERRIRVHMAMMKNGIESGEALRQVVEMKVHWSQKTLSKKETILLAEYGVK